MILAGDVGGTKTRLALYQETKGRLQRMQTETFSSTEYAGLEEIIRSFVEKHKANIRAACLGIPGPVVKGEVRATNLPWIVREPAIKSILKKSSVKLVNDLAATAAAVPHLGTNQLLTLHRGNPDLSDERRYAVVAPGTGLGQAFLKSSEGKFEVFASEGGHTDFSPTDDVQIDLLKYLREKYGRVSYERVICGPGLVNIYSFLKETGRAEEPPDLARRLKEEDPAAVIATSGLAGECEICARALDIFVAVLGAQAGNLVLAFLATAGVYLGGGIPPKITGKLTDGTFLAAYLNKGRLSKVVEQTPVFVILDDHAALLGAASLAIS